ncbi:hypothetical protein QR680_003585 [Steinernema hermaphroditum]|uniref:Uncharacterized protein n=1 Tax=Steinernema hermaphroditum TaxID=289476 RepID=A0AA39HN35_9BILA|nr:hypothetical protein QR680_003585 [Steinernema hermaphroditum]
MDVFQVLNAENAWDLVANMSLSFAVDDPEPEPESEVPEVPEVASEDSKESSDESESEPSTPAPITPASITPASSTPAPITPATRTPAPRTPAPRTPAPSTPAPSTPASSTPAPSTPAPSTSAPKRKKIDLRQYLDVDEEEKPQKSCSCRVGDVQIRPFKQVDFSLLSCCIIRVPETGAELQAELLTCLTTGHLKLRKAVPDTVKVARTVPYNEASDEMLLAKSADYMLVSFSRILGMNLDAIRKLSHSLRCQNSVAVLEPVGTEQTGLKHYLIEYTSHRDIPFAIRGHHLNFLKRDPSYEAFIWITCFHA